MKTFAREIPLVAGPRPDKRVPAFFGKSPLRGIECYFKTEREIASCLSWTVRQAEEWRKRDEIEDHWAELIERFLGLAPRIDKLSGSKLKTGTWFLHYHYLLVSAVCIASCEQSAQPGARPGHLLCYHWSEETEELILAAAYDEFKNESQAQLQRCRELGLNINPVRGLRDQQGVVVARGLQPYAIEKSLGRVRRGRSLASKG